MVQWLLLAVFFLFPVIGHAQPLHAAMSAFEPSLRVGILSNQQNVEISADSSFAIVNTSTGKVLGNFGAKDIVIVSIKKAGFSINNIPVEAAGLNILIKNDHLVPYREQYVSVNQRRYRGDIGIYHTVGKPGITVINTLPIEQYLYGVIKNEISPEWPREAVKAQAVAARTYALANNTKHQADGFDICATTDCQVYGGRDSEAPKATAAVDATRGLVLTYKDKLISAYFHSSSGGYTENSENVWSSSQPYLRGVADFDQNSPYYKWEKKLTLASLNQIITDAGYNIGSLQAIELSPLTIPSTISADRGVSGRVKSVYLKGTTGTIQLSGTKLRNMLNLKSTLFDVTLVKSYSELAMPVYAGTDRKDQLHGLSVLTAKKSRLAALEPTDFVVISGFGWGHGLGLSQWGAKAMAESGPIGNTEYFKDILKHYYQGVEIKKAYQ